jgi:hypothetical protein
MEPVVQQVLQYASNNLARLTFPGRWYGVRGRYSHCGGLAGTGSTQPVMGDCEVTGSPHAFCPWGPFPFPSLCLFGRSFLFVDCAV